MIDMINPGKGSHLGLLLIDTLRMEMIDARTNVYVLLLVQVMKEQCSWLGESC